MPISTQFVNSIFTTKPPNPHCDQSKLMMVERHIDSCLINHIWLANNRKKLDNGFYLEIMLSGQISSSITDTEQAFLIERYTAVGWHVQLFHVENKLNSIKLSYLRGTTYAGTTKKETPEDTEKASS